MGVDYRVFYGYGYEISNEKAFNLTPEKYDKLIDSDYTQFLDGYSYERRCFFGIILNAMNDCDMYKDMINEYKNIFNESPGMASHYIGFAVT